MSTTLLRHLGDDREADEELVRRAAEVLHVLGVRRGDSVGLMLDDGPDLRAWDLAAAAHGALACTFDEALGPAALRAAVQEAEPRILVTDPRYADELLDLHGVQHLLVLDDDAEQLELLRDPAFDFDALR